MREKIILVIDDDEMNLQIAKMILERKLPCKVLSADNGVDGIEILKSRRVHLVLLDVMMPDFDGIETLQEIRNDPQIKNVPVMMLTATVDVDTIKKVGALGVKDYIKKPFLPADFLRRVEKKLSEIHSEEILILGDDEKKLQAMQKIIEENFPHEALTATTIDAAEKILREAEPSLIIADEEMKFVNGFKFLTLPAIEKIPFALTTSEKILELLEKLKPEVPEEKIIEPPKIEEPPKIKKVAKSVVVHEEKKKIANVVTNLIGYRLV